MIFGGSLLVAGKHGELGDAQLMQFGEHCLGVGTRHIAQHDARDQPAVNGHVGGHFVRLQQTEARTQRFLFLSVPGNRTARSCLSIPAQRGAGR